MELESIKQEIWSALAKIEDPEIGLTITELGLIYDVQVKDKENAEIKMTFTSMACPYGPQLKAQVHANSTRIVPNVDVEVVFSPPWDPHQMASSEAKELLGIYQ